MEVLEAIRSRRSVRQYSSEPVARESINRILEAGIWAPSTKNLQPWHFLVVEGQVKDQVAEILQHVAEQMIEDSDPLERARGYGTRKSARIISEAPVLITVWNTAPVSKGQAVLLQDTNPGRLLAWTVETQSVAAAIQNMLLAAHGIGLGGLWICDLNHAAAQTKEYLSVEDDLMAGVAIGYPNETPTLPARRSLAEVVSWIDGVSKD